jgi:hypothetical protein
MQTLKSNVLLDFLRISIALVLCILPLTCTAQYDFETNADNTITITGYSGTNAILMIPSETNGYPITSIAGDAFQYLSGVVSITIPSSITNIGDQAFRFSTSITEVYFQSNAPSFGYYIFFGDDSVIVYYPPGTTGWDPAILGRPAIAFPFSFTTNSGGIQVTGYNGTNSDVAVPYAINGEPVTSIDSYAFQDSWTLTTVSISDNVNTIGDYAFASCSNLNYVTIGMGLTNIGTATFTNCKGLTGVYFNGNGPMFGADVFANDDNATVYYLPDTTNWNSNVDSRPTVVLPFTYTFTSGAASIDSYIGGGGDVIIPDFIKGRPVTVIGESSFEYCTTLTSITMGTNVTSIGDWAFFACTNLTSLTIGPHVNDIGYWAFNSCIGLTNVVIPDSVTTIGDYAFEYLGYLSSVTIGSNVSSIGDWAFSGDGSLTVYFKGNPPAFGSWVFLWDLGMRTYYLPEATGWENYGSVYCWNPVASVNEVGIGPHTNGFSFNITGTPDIPILVEACTNLLNAIWTPLQSCTLTNGLILFREPEYTNHHSRFYRISSP